MAADEPSERSLLHNAALAIERGWDRLLARVRRSPDRVTVVPFMGHGTSSHVVAAGRVLRDAPVTAATSIEPLPTRMARMARRFLTHEIADFEIAVTVGGRAGVTRTDDEGYYRIDLIDVCLDGDRLHYPVAIEAPGTDVDVTVAPTSVMVPTARAKRIVVSDIDDTVLQSGAMHTPSLVLTTATGSAMTRAPFPGVAQLYEGLSRGPGLDEDNCFFYVSSSPWNLYDFLQAFIQRSALPTGPLFLRDLGVDDDKFIKGEHGDHKLAAIDQILEVHDLPVVLIGDTGQHDAPIYRQVAERYPGRVEAVLLRHVADEVRGDEIRADLAALDVPWALGGTSVELARSAVEFGLVDTTWPARIDPTAA